MFVNRILNLFRKIPTRNAYSLMKIFRWICFGSLNSSLLIMALHFSGKNLLRKMKPYVSMLPLLEWEGFGVIKHILLLFFGIPKQYRNIANLEMLNILIALRVWADQWAHKEVLFRCDNLAVVQVIRTSKTRDEFLTCCLRNIWLVVSIYDIKLQMQHISGKNNRVADALSRLYSDKPIVDDLKCDLDTKYKFYRVSPAYFNLDLTI